MGDAIIADLSGIGKELKSCSKKYAAAVRKEIRTAVLESGAEVLALAKSNASWSSRIPGAIGLRTTFGAYSAGVTLRTNQRKAPHARPLEFGSQGNGNTVRHPGHGNREGKWGEQPTRPFFFKAVKDASPGIDRRIMAAIDKACRDAGFR